MSCTRGRRLGAVGGSLVLVLATGAAGAPSALAASADPADRCGDAGATFVDYSYYDDALFTVVDASYCEVRFTSGGTWTVPAGITAIDAMVVGAGGGGGGGAGGGDLYSAAPDVEAGGGGGGGAGEVVYVEDRPVSAGDTLTITIGTGGSGGVGTTRSVNDPIDNDVDRGDPGDPGGQSSLELADGTLTASGGTGGEGGGRATLAGATDASAAAANQGGEGGLGRGTASGGGGGRVGATAAAGGPLVDSTVLATSAGRPFADPARAVEVAGGGGGGLGAGSALGASGSGASGGDGGRREGDDGGDAVVAGHGGGGGAGNTNRAADPSTGGTGGAGSAGLVVLRYPAFTAPGAPTITGMTPGGGSLEVAFTPPADDGGTAITNYEHSIDGGSTWTAVAPVVTSSPLTITGLIGGTEYDVRLRAVNAVGAGAASNLVSGTPTAAPAPPDSSAEGSAEETPLPTPGGTVLALAPGDVAVVRDPVPPTPLPPPTTTVVGDRLVIEDDGLRLEIGGDAGAPRSGTTVVRRDGTITCLVCGGVPGSVVTTWLFSEPRMVAAGRVAADGCVNIVVPLASPLDGGDAPVPGDHTLQVVVPTATGRTAVGIGVTLTGPIPAAIPAGGGPALGSVRAALALVWALLLLPSVMLRRSGPEWRHR